MFRRNLRRRSACARVIYRWNVIDQWARVLHVFLRSRRSGPAALARPKKSRRLRGREVGMSVRWVRPGLPVVHRDVRGFILRGHENPCRRKSESAAHQLSRYTDAIRSQRACLVSTWATASWLYGTRGCLGFRAQSCAGQVWMDGQALRPARFSLDTWGRDGRFWHKMV